MNHQPMSRGMKITLAVMAVCILVPGGYGFGEKLRQFIYTVRNSDGGDFAIVPIANYLLVAAGMVCFFIYAILHGMFRNIEQPKFDMLDQEDALDQREEAERRKKHDAWSH